MAIAPFGTGNRITSGQRGLAETGMEIMTDFVGQLTAISLLIVFLFGVMCGVIGSAAHGSRFEDRGCTLLGASPNPVSAGGRVIHGVYTSADEFMLGLLPDGEANGANRGIDDSGSQEQELDQ